MHNAVENTPLSEANEEPIGLASKDSLGNQTPFYLKAHAGELKLHQSKAWATLIHSKGTDLTPASRFCPRRVVVVQPNQGTQYITGQQATETIKFRCKTDFFA